ncbi:MAG: VWA domain-containing protein [Desulfobacteraceae bacterium]|nr:MAG: VWA domain-containing protein [Desulfobacteraceae bacterium]
MKFAHIHMLFLIWALPLLVLAYLYGRRKRRRVLREFADERALGLLVPPSLTARRRLRSLLVLAAALLLVIAMAGPQYGFEWREIERRGVDLVVALDCSRSMLAEDIAPNRLARAKHEIIDLLGMLQGDRVALVAFSGSAFLQCPLTLDYAAFDLFLNVLTPDYLPLGGTDLIAAVQTAITAFDPRSGADKAIILITDGEHTGRGDPQEAAEAARTAGIKIFSVGVGSAEGVPVPSAQGGFKKDRGGQIVLTRTDEALLTRMAMATGGTYVRSVAGDMDLDVIYRDRIRGGMEQATLESGRRQVWADHYQWPLLLALVLLMTALVVPEAKKPLTTLMLGLAVLIPSGPSQAGPLHEGYRAYHQGHYDEALGKFIEGQLRDPENPELLYNLGNAYYKTGEYEAARAHYSQALSEAAADLKARLLYNMGNASYRLGSLGEAVQNYKAALQLAPDDVQARENLAFVEKQLQQQQQNKQNPQDGPQEKAGQDPTRAGAAPQSGEERQQPPPADQNSNGNPPDGAGKAPQYGSAMEDQGNSTDRAATAANPQQDPAADREAGDARPKIPSSQAAHMLNRLKDEPGRAMMPAYGKQPVDKDW